MARTASTRPGLHTASTLPASTLPRSSFDRSTRGRSPVPGSSVGSRAVWPPGHVDPRSRGRGQDVRARRLPRPAQKARALVRGRRFGSRRQHAVSSRSRGCRASRRPPAGTSGLSTGAPVDCKGLPGDFSRSSSSICRQEHAWPSTTTKRRRPRRLGMWCFESSSLHGLHTFDCASEAVRGRPPYFRVFEPTERWR